VRYSERAHGCPSHADWQSVPKCFSLFWVGLFSRVGTKDPKFCKQGDSVIVRIKMNRSLCVERYKDFSQMGRFMLRDQGNTIGVGIINELKYPEDKKKKEGEESK